MPEIDKLLRVHKPALFLNLHCARMVNRLDFAALMVLKALPDQKEELAIRILDFNFATLPVSEVFGVQIAAASDMQIDGFFKGPREVEPHVRLHHMRATWCEGCVQFCLELGEF